MKKKTENKKLEGLFYKRDLLESARPNTNEAEIEIIKRYDDQLILVNKQIEEALR